MNDSNYNNEVESVKSNNLSEDVGSNTSSSTVTRKNIESKNVRELTFDDNPSLDTLYTDKDQIKLKTSGYENTALPLGIVAICLHWLIFLPTPINVIISIPVFTLGSLSIFFYKKDKNFIESLAPSENEMNESYGWNMNLSGAIMGTIAIVLSIFWLLTSLFLIWPIS